MRLIVAQTDPTRLVHESDSLTSAALPVGVVRWPEGRITVVVKVSYRYTSSAASETTQPLKLAAEHEPIGEADLVTFKPMTDVLISGHAYAAGPKEQQWHRVGFSVSNPISIRAWYAVIDTAAVQDLLDDGG